MIPMAMDAAHLAEYVRIYDVSLPHSLVAMDGAATLGLAMLGVRPGRAWVTRLGVLPVSRGRGTGAALVGGLLAQARSAGLPEVILEVIQGNTPAHSLFRKLGFVETRELLVLRRPPRPAEPGGPPAVVEWLAAPAALDLLRAYPPGRGSAHPLGLAWTNEVESLANAGGVQGLVARLNDGSSGWLVFRHSEGMLSHFGLHTQAGDPGAVGLALLNRLYSRFPAADTYIENLTTLDPHVGALRAYGFVDAFRRIEMVLGS
jgi:ribosomal protein S18 acetylase RimI-like enzyme